MQQQQQQPQWKEQSTGQRKIPESLLTLQPISLEELNAHSKLHSYPHRQLQLTQLWPQGTAPADSDLVTLTLLGCAVSAKQGDIYGKLLGAKGLLQPIPRATGPESKVQRYARYAAAKTAADSIPLTDKLSIISGSALAAVAKSEGEPCYSNSYYASRCIRMLRDQFEVLPALDRSATATILSTGKHKNTKKTKLDDHYASVQRKRRRGSDS